MNDQPAEPEADKNMLRESMRQHFEAWLDDLLGDEPPPDGVDQQLLDEASETGRAPATDQYCDLLTLWSAMTTLTQEVKLQGRTFKQLQETLAPVSQLDSKLAALGQSQLQSLSQLDQQAAQLRELVEAGEKARQTAALESELLEVLLDLHGRFKRGLDLCSGAGQQPVETERVTFWQRLRGQRAPAPVQDSAIEALREGYALTLARLSEVLEQRRIKPIEAVGQAFDPHTMQAVDVVPSDKHEEGTVLEVYQPGFLREGQVIRLAKVKVAGRGDRDDVNTGEKEFVA